MKIKYILIFITLICLVLICSCKESKLVSRELIGKCTDIEIFNPDSLYSDGAYKTIIGEKWVIVPPYRLPYKEKKLIGQKVFKLIYESGSECILFQYHHLASKIIKEG